MLVYLVVLLQSSQEAHLEAVDDLLMGGLEGYSGVPLCEQAEMESHKC